MASTSPQTVIRVPEIQALPLQTFGVFSMPLSIGFCPVESKPMACVFSSSDRARSCGSSSLRVITRRVGWF